MSDKILRLVLMALLLPLSAAAADPAIYMPDPKDMLPLVPAGEVARYTPENLWELINGEAELYRDNGLAQAATRRFEDPEDPLNRVVVSVFTMNDPLGAFGLFATYRPPGALPSGVGNGSYLEGHRAFFWQGPVFFMADAEGPWEMRDRGLMAALQAAASRLGPVPAEPEALKSIRGLTDPSSISYHPDHVLGRNIFPPGLSGRSSGGVPFFVSTVQVDTDRLISDFQGVLEGAREVKSEHLRGITGTDPSLGVITVVVGNGIAAGARTSADDPQVLRYLGILLGVAE
jgi:hypothetical protein